MIMKKIKFLAIIPARGGSKGIPGKNIKTFCGKPLLHWTILAGIKSGVLDRLILSTDSKNIADIGEKAGAETPFLRPARLAQDKTPTLPVLRHAVAWLKKNQNYSPDYVVLLEPTSACRRPIHIQEAVQLALKTGADSVISMSEVPHDHNAHWQFKLDKGNKAMLVIGNAVKNIIKRRQDLPRTYYRNGIIYVLKTDLLFASKPSIYGKDVRVYVTSSKYSKDINNQEDWIDAENSFRLILKEEAGLHKKTHR